MVQIEEQEAYCGPWVPTAAATANSDVITNVDLYPHGSISREAMIPRVSVWKIVAKMGCRNGVNCEASCEASVNIHLQPSRAAAIKVPVSA